MGDPRKTRKHFKRPLQIWNKASIEREKALTQTYGLRNKREIWRTETMLRKKRHSARSLLALSLEDRVKREKELLQSLARLGILDQNATLDDVLTLAVESFLERRLQSLVWRKGLANTARQARQFIIHGHIAIAGGRVTAPGYIVSAEEENKLGYYAGKKMVLKPAIKEKEKKAEKSSKREKKTIKEEFESAKPTEQQKEKGENKEKAQPKREGQPKEKKQEKPKEEKKEQPKEKKQEKPKEGREKMEAKGGE